jgi:hypothetical protein
MNGYASESDRRARLHFGRPTDSSRLGHYLDQKSTFSRIGVCGDNFESMSRCISLNSMALGGNGIGLIFGRHSQVLRRRESGRSLS